MTTQPEKPAATAGPAPPSHDESPAAADADVPFAPPATSTVAPIAPAKKANQEPEAKPADEKADKKEESPTTASPAVAAEAKDNPEHASTPVPAPIPPVAAATVSPATTPSTKSNGEGGADHEDGVNPPDFEGTVNTNNDLPSAETIAKIADYVLLDRDSRTHTFKSLYTGKHAARRVLIIFVRHFYCGNCQEYLRSLSSSITPEALLRLPLSTFIAVVGCGDPGLIDMYAAATGCPFPIYADPTRRLYSELGMVRTLALGTRPAYQNQGLFKSSVASVVQGLKQLKTGLATKGGDARQVGGEFLFEPLDLQSPMTTPWSEEKGVGAFNFNPAETGRKRSSDTSLDGKTDDADGVEEKRVTWCHRMRTTRDHAEIPELMEVLGLDGQGMPIKDKKRWSRALETRKGTGLSLASQISAMKAQAGTVS